MMERYPDIEVYVASVAHATLNRWLDEALAAPPLGQAGKGKWKTTGYHQGAEIPVLLVDNAADGFASLWFDSPSTPWTTDQECAQSAAEALQVEVRCSLGGWNPGDDPDRFWQVLPGGKEQAIEWPDSGR